MPQSPRKLEFNGFRFVPGKKARGIASLCRPWGNRGLFGEIGETTSDESNPASQPPHSRPLRSVQAARKDNSSRRFVYLLADPLEERTIMTRMPEALFKVPDLVHLPIQVFSGVYFLCLEGQVVYVGQSVNVLARIGEHSLSYRSLIKFDSAFYIPAPAASAAMLRALELQWIQKLKPPFNRAGLESVRNYLPPRGEGGR